MRIMMKFWFPLFCSLFVLTNIAQAEEISGLYQQSVVVKSQSAKELKRAAKAALETVFIRVSGNANVASQQQIRSAVAKARSYLKQFSYQRHPLPDQSGEELRVLMEFEQQLVDDKLRFAGLPIWPTNRPSILVWLVVDDIDGRRFMGSEATPRLVEQMVEHTARRGLALHLPLLDLEDSMVLSPNELWQLNLGQAQRAAQRYQADTLLIGRVTHLSNDEWWGSWIYQFDNEQISFDTESKDSHSYIATALDTIADRLADSYAIVPIKMTEGDLLMRVEGVKTFTDYARLIQYLESKAAIRQANPIDIRDGEVIIKLTADGQLQQLQQALSLDKKLIPAEKIAQTQYSVQLNYVWLREERK
jgi:hypothetical protein